MGDVLIQVVGALLGLAVMSAGVFFTGMPGMQILKSYRYLRRLKAELEPVARAVGATTSTGCDTRTGTRMYYFTFPNEKWAVEGKEVAAWLTLMVSADGFNLYVPSFSPPIERSADYEALVRAIQRLQKQSEIPA